MSSMKVNIGKTLKELRKANQMTQQQVADTLGLSRVNYTRYETGASNPDYETLLMLANYFDVSLDFLFGRKDI